MTDSYPHSPLTTMPTEQLITMPTEQLIIGAGVTLLSLFGLYRERWMLTNTRKGQRLVAWFGEASALWVLRGLLTLAAIFGALLASNVIQPVRW